MSEATRILVVPRDPHLPPSAMERAALARFLAQGKGLDGKPMTALVIGTPVDVYQCVDGRWEYVANPGIEVHPVDRLNLAPETRDPHECPGCGHVGTCDLSQHVFFATNQAALRCRACRHIWAVDPDTPYRYPAVEVEVEAEAPPEPDPMPGTWRDREGLLR